MIKSIEENIRWKAFSLILARLKTITRANGYQTQPYVTDDYLLAKAEAEVPYLLVVSSDEVVRSQRTRAAWTMGYDITIISYIPTSGREVELELAKAIQDYRTCLCTYLDSLATELGQGGEVSFGPLSSSQGSSTDEAWASFKQTITIIYNNGTIW